MHELSVTESILNLCKEYALKENATKVTDIHLVIGRLSSIVDDSVQFYWDFVAENSICEGAKLHFERKPAILLCVDCNREYGINEKMTPCPVCGGYNTRIISGEEFYLESIEIEKEESTIK